MFGGCLPAIWIAFVQFPGRNPWRLIHLNILFFIPLIIIVNWETKMYLYLISVFYVEKIYEFWVHVENIKHKQQKIHCQISCGTIFYMKYTYLHIVSTRQE